RRLKPQLSCEGGRGLIRRIPTRLEPVLEAILDQGCGDSPCQAAATKLTGCLNLDLHFPPTDRCRGSTGDERAPMQDAQTDSPGHELLVGSKVVDEGGIKLCGELRHLFEPHLPQFKSAGQCLTESSQLVDIELCCLEGFAMIHGSLPR